MEQVNLSLNISVGRAFILGPALGPGTAVSMLVIRGVALAILLS
jgi:hypothetical protein